MEARIDRAITSFANSPLKNYTGGSQAVSLLIEEGVAANKYENLSEPIQKILEIGKNAYDLIQERAKQSSHYQKYPSMGKLAVLESVVDSLSAEDAAILENFKKKVQKRTSSNPLDKPIVNKDKFPQVDFLSAESFETIGNIAGEPLILIGYEKGTNNHIVSKDLGGMYHAISLEELTLHTQDKIHIYKED